MVGSTLVKIRSRIDTLSTADGEFRVICSRTGTQPVPIIGKRFPDREAAAQAAQAAAAYRGVLRRWDPRAPYYDFIACEVPAGLEPSLPPIAERDDPGTGTGTGYSSFGSPSTLTGFCHDIAAAVFETLSKRNHDVVESTVMSTYCDQAEQFDDPDSLCFHLLTTLSHELDTQLTTAQQAAVLDDAATNFRYPGAGTATGTRTGSGDDPAPDSIPSVNSTSKPQSKPQSNSNSNSNCNLSATHSTAPLAATFERLQRVGLLDQYTLTTRSDTVVGRQTWQVTIDGYALATDAKPLPAIPIALDLLGRLPNANLQLSTARRLTDHVWQFDLATTTEDNSTGLFCVPLAESA